MDTFGINYTWAGPYEAGGGGMFNGVVMTVGSLGMFGCRAAGRRQ